MRVTFFGVAERKSPKKGRPYCARPFAALRATCDARTGAAPQNSLRAARSVQTTAASQCTKCVCPSAHARTPCPALLGTRRREPRVRTSTRAIASLRCARPRLAGASATRCAVGAERGDGPRGCSAVGCLAPHPATAPPQGCPFAPRRGRRLGVAFSLVTFFWRSKRKLLARRATPGSRTQNGHAVAAAQKPRQAQLKRMGREETIKTIASSAFCINA